MIARTATRLLLACRGVQQLIYAIVVILAIPGCRAPQLCSSYRQHERSGSGASHDAPFGEDFCQDHQATAASDPLAFLERCRAHYQASVTDYRCRFATQERIGGVLGAEQEMDVRFRQRPFSVDVRWVRNAAQASRVNYVAGRWIKDGREQFLVEPAGWLGLLFPSVVKRHIDGIEAKAAARRTIDQFGFKKTLDWIIHYSELAADSPEFDLRYAGQGAIDGRATHVIERRLPFAGPDGPYPDRVQVIHIDCEWLVPTGCFSYADDARQVLLGSYVSTDVEFNAGLTDEDFK